MRGQEEYEAGPVPGSRSILLDRLLYYLHEFTWADELVVYGGSEEGAQKAAETLRIANFRKARILKGGFLGWMKEAA